MKASLRLHFRDLTTKDTAALIEIYSDAEAMKFRANPPVINTEDALKMIAQAKYEGEEFSSKRWAAVREDTNELIGTFVLSYDNHNPTCTIGYSIGKSSWGKGYGKELLTAIIREVKESAPSLWEQANSTIIKAVVHPQNLASIAILEKQQFYQVDVNSSQGLLIYCLNLLL
jgi:RimJ/RimL family protein N-acetyltransferase